MTPDDFESKIVRPGYFEMLELCRTKGVEYAGTEDKLANFKNTAKEAGLDPLQVCYIFMNKHYNAIQAYVRNGKVFSEPIKGRIRDCQLYLTLLEALIYEREQDGAEQGNSNQSTERIVPSGQHLGEEEGVLGHTCPDCRDVNGLHFSWCPRLVAQAKKDAEDHARGYGAGGADRGPKEAEPEPTR